MEGREAMMISSPGWRPPVVVARPQRADVAVQPALQRVGVGPAGEALGDGGMVQDVGAHLLGELVRREHHGIEIDLLEVVGWRFRQAAVRVRARAPGVIDAA